METIKYNFSDHELKNILNIFNCAGNYESRKGTNEVIYYQDVSTDKVKVIQNVLINYFDNSNTTYKTGLFFIKIKGYKISDQVFSYKKDGDYFDLITVIDKLPHHKQGLSYTATGYGSKIPTFYKVFKNNRFYRVYCMQYSNAGSLYILENNEKTFLN